MRAVALTLTHNDNIYSPQIYEVTAVVVNLADAHTDVRQLPRITAGIKNETIAVPEHQLEWVNGALANQRNNKLPRVEADRFTDMLATFLDYNGIDLNYPIVTISDDFPELIRWTGYIGGFQDKIRLRHNLDPMLLKAAPNGSVSDIYEHEMGLVDISEADSYSYRDALVLAAAVQRYYHTTADTADEG